MYDVILIFDENTLPWSYATLLHYTILFRLLTQKVIIIALIADSASSIFWTEIHTVRRSMPNRG